MTERAGDGIQECSKTMKRRGILAAAGAAVAALAAKQVAQPVSAVLTPVYMNTTTNNPTSETSIVVPSTVTSFPDNFVFTVGNLATGLNITGIGVTGGGTSPGIDTSSATGIGITASGGTGGVSGVSTGLFNPTGGYGVRGVGDSVGVVGQSHQVGTSGVVGFTFNPPTTSGVFGGTVGISSQAGLPGVYGYNSAAGKGVLGVSFSDVAVNGYVPDTLPAGGGNTNPNTVAVAAGNFATGSGSIGLLALCDVAGGTGVKGSSASGFPIIGTVTGGANLAAGVLGAGTKGPGVQGQSTGGHGLVGTTDATDGHAGLTGNANHTGGVGLQGIAPNYGQPTVGKAGDFYGNVKITGGSLMAPTMQAVVPHAGDGTYRALHTVTSPEGWVEDFGRGTLAAGKAEVKMDADFAALVHTDDYHVFLTADGPQHLHLAERTAGGFIVAATSIGTAGGPKRPEGTGTFSYRVVARRKDITSERLAKVAAPTAPKVPTAFMIPETPEVKPPTKKP